MSCLDGISTLAWVDRSSGQIDVHEYSNSKWTGGVIKLSRPADSVSHIQLFEWNKQAALFAIQSGDEEYSLTLITPPGFETNGR